MGRKLETANFSRLQEFTPASYVRKKDPLLSSVSVRLNQPMGGADIFLDRISSFVLTLYDEFSEFFCLNIDS